MIDYVFIGDDFTGASDTLATLAEAGRTARLFLEPPTCGACAIAGLDAVGVATDLRASPPAVIGARLTAIAPKLAALAPRVVHYKVCSTFDSAPHVGNIATAIGTLQRALSPVATLVLGGQPSLGRYCLFGHLFARAPDGETYRIDRHPIMSRHPVTPMGESDLALHLAAQGAQGIENVTRPALASLLERISAHSAAILLLDAIDQSDVATIGTVISGAPEGPVLIVGASSVAEACVGTSARQPATEPAELAPTPGPRLAVAGSRSAQTARQVAAAATYERCELTALNLGEGLEMCAARVADGLREGRNILVALNPQADYGLSAQELSERIARLTACIVEQMPVRAIAVAGGDTSSAVVAALGFSSLSFEGRGGAGVAICRGHADRPDRDGMRLLLKGGQLGPLDLFDRFATGA